MCYLPGKAIVLSRLPAQDWFTVDEAAEAAGWSPTYIKERIKDGKLVAQQWQGEPDRRAGAGGNHLSYRIHVDDLVLFILLNGRGRYQEGKPLGDVLAIVKTWPKWLLRHLHTAIGRTLSASGAPIPLSGNGNQPAPPGATSPAGAGEGTSPNDATLIES